MMRAPCSGNINWMNENYFALQIFIAEEEGKQWIHILMFMRQVSFYYKACT